MEITRTFPTNIYRITTPEGDERGCLREIRPQSTLPDSRLQKCPQNPTRSFSIGAHPFPNQLFEIQRSPNTRLPFTDSLRADKWIHTPEDIRLAQALQEIGNDLGVLLHFFADLIMGITSREEAAIRFANQSPKCQETMKNGNWVDGFAECLSQKAIETLSRVQVARAIDIIEMGYKNDQVLVEANPVLAHKIRTQMEKQGWAFEKL